MMEKQRLIYKCKKLMIMRIRYLTTYEYRGYIEDKSVKIPS